MATKKTKSTKSAPKKASAVSSAVPKVGPAETAQVNTPSPSASGKSTAAPKLLKAVEEQTPAVSKSKSVKAVVDKKIETPAVDAKLESNLAKQPPRALNSPIRVFQIYFEGWQRELLDPAFYPLDRPQGRCPRGRAIL